MRVWLWYVLWNISNYLNSILNVSVRYHFLVISTNWDEWVVRPWFHWFHLFDTLVKVIHSRTATSEFASKGEWLALMRQVIQHVLSIFRGHFFSKGLTIDTRQLTRGDEIWASFMSSKPYWCFTLAPGVRYAISCYNRPPHIDILKHHVAFDHVITRPNCILEMRYEKTNTSIYKQHT